MLPFLNDILSIIAWQKSLLQISFAFSYILHSLSGIPDGRKMRLTNAQMYTQYRHCSSSESSAPVQKSFKIYSFQELLSTDFIHSGHSCSCGSRSLPGGEVLCWVSPVHCHCEYFCLKFFRISTSRKSGLQNVKVHCQPLSAEGAGAGKKNMMGHITPQHFSKCQRQA